MLRPIRTVFLEEPLLLEDFPEAVHPFRCLENSSKRQGQQHIQGRLTHVHWGQDKLVFPAVDSEHLPMALREDGYEMALFLRLVAGHEARDQRCRLCYEMRLMRTAKVAAREGFDAITTTLLISPHQDQDMLLETGEKVARESGVEFHFENFRRGWSERGRLTREHDLYRQQYCGCIYSEWERSAGEDVSTSQTGVRDV